MKICCLSGQFSSQNAAFHIFDVLKTIQVLFLRTSISTGSYLGSCLVSVVVFLVFVLFLPSYTTVSGRFVAR